VPAEVKAELLDLAGHAIEHGWPDRRAAAALGLDHAQYYHWAARCDQGQLEDAAPRGHPLHGLLAWERAAVVELFDAWGEIDRSHRKLAHRGSRIGLVHVSE
jgi:putative transposase